MYRAEYEPDLVGTYRVEVSHQGRPISSHPFYVEVTDPASVRVSQVQEAYAGKESYFIGRARPSSFFFFLSKIFFFKSLKFY